MMEFKTIRMDIKETEDGADFAGLLSVAGVKDWYDEIVDEGAFTRTLKHHKGKVPLLADHDHTKRIGVAELKENGKNLELKGHINHEKPLAVETLSDIKFGLKHKTPVGLSIGYNVVNYDVLDGVRHLKEIALWEGSVVTFPANPKALTTDAKSIDRQMSHIIELVKKLGPDHPLPAPTCALIKGALDSLNGLHALASKSVPVIDHTLYGAGEQLGLDRIESEDAAAIEDYTKYLKELTEGR